MKRFLVALMIIVLCFTLCACDFRGYDMVDTNYHFDKAIIALPNGTTIEVDIEKWADSADGEQITITDTDGNRYLTSSYNCVLIEENNRGEQQMKDDKQLLIAVGVTYICILLLTILIGVCL